MSTKNFRKYLKDIAEETTSGDIATVDTKLDLTQRYEKHKCKGKKCKAHKKYNCIICEENEDSKWN